MNSLSVGQFDDVNDYADYVNDCLRNDVIPSPPSTPAEVLVIWDEYPHLMAEYLPLTLADTPFRRALAELVNEIADQQSLQPF